MFHRCFAWLAVPVPAQLYKHRQSAVASVGAEQDSQLEEGGGWWWAVGGGCSERWTDGTQEGKGVKKALE